MTDDSVRQRATMLQMVDSDGVEPSVTGSNPVRGAQPQH